MKDVSNIFGHEEDQPELEGMITHDVSPFTKGFRVKTRGKKIGIGGESLAVVDMETNQIHGAAEIVQRVAVDSETFVKVFQLQLGAFFGLSSAGAKVLTAFWREMSRFPNVDLIYMSEATAKAHAIALGGSISKATYFRGRENLIENGFIAPAKEQNRYFINPAIFWNGDRVKFITELNKAPEIVGPGESFKNGM